MPEIVSEAQLLGVDRVEFRGVATKLARSTSGEALLASFILNSGNNDPGKRWLATGALAEGTGPSGLAALESVLESERDNGDKDVIMAALSALAWRLGPASTPQLASFVGHRSRNVSNEAVLQLGLVGDARSWPTMKRRWASEVLRFRRGRRGPSPILYLASYFARNIDPESNEEAAFVSDIRGIWDRLPDSDHAWFLKCWPGAVPDATGGPDAVALAQWVDKHVRAPEV